MSAMFVVSHLHLAKMFCGDVLIFQDCNPKLGGMIQSCGMVVYTTNHNHYKY